MTDELRPSPCTANPIPRLPGDCRVAIQRAYAGLGWVVPQALANCTGGDEIYYDQVAQIEVPHWSSGRVTLIGDACHAVSLLAGQGASLAVAGAFVLAETLARAHDIDSALARYEAQFQPVVTEIQRVARRGMHWFLPESRRQVLVDGWCLVSPACRGSTGGSELRWSASPERR